MADTTRPHRYFDDVATGYDALYEDPMSQAENLVVAQEIGRLVSSSRNGVSSVLDIGCGTGLMLDMAQHFGCEDARYTGIDFSEEMLKVFWGKYAARPNTQAFHGNMNTFNFQDLHTDFDLALSTFGSFSYADNPAKFLSDISQVLREGNGHILVMAYSRFSVRNILARIRHNDPRLTDERRPYVYRNDDDNHSHDGPDAHFHTSQSLIKAAQEAGLHRISVQGLNFFLDSVDTTHENFDAALRSLQVEREQISIPDLSHSLILTATNYE